MELIGKLGRIEHWRYQGSVYCCLCDGDTIFWSDGSGFHFGNPDTARDLTNARAEALAKMPKRVEFEEIITSQLYFEMGGKWIERLNFKQKHPYICDHQKVEYYTDESLFSTGQKVKVIIEEVVE